MTHFFDRRDYWGNRLSVWIVVLMAFVAPLGWWSLRQLRFEDDVAQWLPDSDPEVAADRWIHEQFPLEERILLTWDESSLNDPRMGKLIETLTGQVDDRGVRRGGSPYVSSIVDPVHELIVMQNNGIEPHEAVRRLQGTILGVGPLRLRLTESGKSALRKTKRELQTAIAKKFGLEAKILDATPDLTSLTSIPVSAETGDAAKLPSPPAILSVSGQSIETPQLEHDLQVSWKGMRIGSPSTVALAEWLTSYVPERGSDEPLVENAFFAPGSPIALMIGISEAGLADKDEAIAAIRSACIQVGIPGESVHLAGKIVSASELKTQVAKAIWNPSYPLTQIHRRSPLLTSLLICAVLSIGLLRNIRLATLTLSISLFAMVMALALIPLTGGTVNVLQIVLPTLVLVFTMSGAIHIANYWRHAACRSGSQAIGEMMKSCWMPCLFGGLVMVVGFVTLGTSRLGPIREFGLYAAGGTMVSVVVLLFGLPSLLQIWKGTPPTAGLLDQTGWRLFGQLLSFRPGLQTYALMAICIGCGMGMSRLTSESRLTQLFPDDARIDRDNWYIEDNLAGIMPLEMIVRFDAQAQKDTNFVERMELVRKVQEQVRQSTAITGLTSLVDLQPVSQLAPENASFLQRTKFNKQASAIEQTFRESETSEARSFYAVSAVGSHFDKFDKRQFSKSGDELWRMTAQVRVMAEKQSDVILTDLNRITQDVLRLQPGSEHLIAGAFPIYVKTQKAVMQTLKSSYGVALAVIFGVFVVTLRSFGAALITLIVNVAPMSVVFGVISWNRQPIDIGSMMAASISLGFAASGALHVLVWARTEMKNGMARRDAMLETLVHCGPAVLHSSAVVMLSLFVFAYADLPPISKFGWVAAAMTGVGLIGNLVLLPLLLGGSVGKLFESAKVVEVKATFTDEPVASIENPLIASVIQEAAVPEPHIKPHDQATKKRRSSNRRDRDAG